MEQPYPARAGKPARVAATAMAALDLGTNNCRLLIAEPLAEGGFEVIDSFSRIVRLGEGLAASNQLGEQAMERTLAALRICAQIMERHAVALSRCVATEACRRAVNGPAFIRRVRRQTGIELEVLPQVEEAGLAMLGCLPLVEPDAEQVVMVDIGGGSTEIMLLDRRGPRNGHLPGRVVSVPLGVVTLSESLGVGDHPADYAAMVEHVLERLHAGGTAELAAASSEGGLQMLGTSGTVTTLAAMHLGLRRYDRRKVDGQVLSFSAIQQVTVQLRGLGNAARAAHPCIGPGRADLVVAGCAILDAIHRLWPVERLRVADRGLREGILGQLMGLTLEQALLTAPAPGAAA